MRVVVLMGMGELKEKRGRAGAWCQCASGYDAGGYPMREANVTDYWCGLLGVYDCSFKDSGARYWGTGQIYGGDRKRETG